MACNTQKELQEKIVEAYKELGISFRASTRMSHEYSILSACRKIARTWYNEIEKRTCLIENKIVVEQQTYVTGYKLMVEIPQNVHAVLVELAWMNNTGMWRYSGKVKDVTV